MRVTILNYNPKGELEDIDEYYGINKIWFESQEYIKNGKWLHIIFKKGKGKEQGFENDTISIEINKHDDFNISRE